MPNDAKLGLVTGLAIVTLIAVTYYRKDPAGITAAETPTAPAQSNRGVKEPAADQKPAPKPAASPDQPPPVQPAQPPVRPPAEDPFAPENSRLLPPPPLPPLDENSGPALPPPTPSFLPPQPRVD